jgi:putative MFS transporter
MHALTTIELIPETMSEDQRAAALTARLDSLPLTSFDTKIRLVMGAATCFDGFCVFVIGYALPVLVLKWRLTPHQVGILISAGFIGMGFGAIAFGWLAEKLGKIRVMAYAIGLFAVASLLACLAWNSESLAILRAIQGIGLGGEVPIAAAYINELARSKRRGSFFLLYELMFPIGLVAAALVGIWFVPRFGWQSVFLIGGLPAVLSFFITRILPESPRWLITKGRLDEAEDVILQIETLALREGKSLQSFDTLVNPTHPVQNTSWRELFQGIYLPRTLIVWGLWSASFFITQNLIVWLPTIYVATYKMGVSRALRYGLLLNIAHLAGDLLCALMIDHIGRRAWFIFSFLLGGIPFLILWYLKAESSLYVAILACIGSMFIGSNSMAVYLYTPEVYPTRLRCFGTGAASAWMRITTALGSTLIGLTFANYRMNGVFLVLGLVATAGALIALGITETTGRLLEEISP